MTTLIAVYNSDGLVGRCDAKCHEASEPDCDCVCGGMNHGAGRKKAAENTAKHGREMINAWRKEHPDTTSAYLQPMQLAMKALLDSLIDQP